LGHSLANQSQSHLQVAWLVHSKHSNRNPSDRGSSGEFRAIPLEVFNGTIALLLSKAAKIGQVGTLSRNSETCSSPLVVPRRFCGGANGTSDVMVVMTPTAPHPPRNGWPLTLAPKYGRAKPE
jgi:hypothetical protein